VSSVVGTFRPADRFDYVGYQGKSGSDWNIAKLPRMARGDIRVSRMTALRQRRASQIHFFGMSMTVFGKTGRSLKVDL
jgi:hypothetical protein